MFRLSIIVDDTSVLFQVVAISNLYYAFHALVSLTVSHRVIYHPEPAAKCKLLFLKLNPEGKRGEAGDLSPSAHADTFSPGAWPVYMPESVLRSGV